MRTAQQQVDDFNRRFRVGRDVDVLWTPAEYGKTTRHTLVAKAYTWPSGEAVAMVSGVGTSSFPIVVLCSAIHMPPGVGG